MWAQTSITKASECERCPETKPLSNCSECPRKDAHYVGDFGELPADLIIAADYPVVSIAESAGLPHAAFRCDGGIRVRSALEEIKLANRDLLGVNVFGTYAVPCVQATSWKEKAAQPKKAEIDLCKGLLESKLRKSYAVTGKPQVVLAMGVISLKVLGVKVRKMADVQGQVLEHTLSGVPLLVIPSMSLHKLAASPGEVGVFKIELTRALEIAKTGKPPEYINVEDIGYRIPKTLSEVRAICDEIMAMPDNWVLGVDTETTTLFPHQGVRILTVSIAWGTGKACAIALDHKDCPYPYRDAALMVRKVLEGPHPKIFHNGKYDIKVFKALGWTVNNFSWDSLLGEHLLEEDKKGNYKLGNLTTAHFHEFAGYKNKFKEALEAAETDQMSAETSKSKEKIKATFEDVSLDEMLEYAATDADVTRRLAMLQVKRIRAEDEYLNKRYTGINARRRANRKIARVCTAQAPLQSLMKTEILPVSNVLADMEFYGVSVDREYLKTVDDALTETIIKAKAKLYQYIDTQSLVAHFGKKRFTEFNPNSSAHVAAVLYKVGYIDQDDPSSRRRHPILSTTDNGAPSTGEKVLEEIQRKNDCPFIDCLLEYRKAVKAQNTFLRKVLALSQKDGRIHTNYNIFGTVTGRLSSNDINMQNMPKYLAGHCMKKMFIPSQEGNVFVNMDASAAEVRVFAAYSRDEKLIQALCDGLNTHSFFASFVYNPDTLGKGLSGQERKDRLAYFGIDDDHAWSYEDYQRREVMEDTDYGARLSKLRDYIKRIVFGILYGAGPYRISSELGISLADAEEIIKALFDMFPTIPNYINQTKWELQTFGVVETIVGRRRRFPLKGSTRSSLGRAERQAVNFKIQSTASHIVMRTLNHMAKYFADIEARPLITVHDSIAIELPEKYVAQLPDFIKTYGEDYAKNTFGWLPVPFKWDCEVGPNYGELTPLKAFLKNHEKAVKGVDFNG